MQCTTTHARFLRRPEVIRRTGLSRSYLVELEAKGRFPKRVKLSDRASAWIEAEVVEWMESRIAARDAQVRA